MNDGVLLESSEMGSSTGSAIAEESRDDHVAGASPAVTGVPQFPNLLAFALWLALVEGLLEVAVFVIRGEIGRHGVYRKNPNFPWMIPASQLVVFGLVGLIAWLTVRGPATRLASVARYGLVVLAFLSLLLAIPGLGAVGCTVLATGLTVWTVPALVTHGVAFTRFVRRSLLVLVGVVVILAGYCSLAAVMGEPLALSRLPAARPGTPNVVVIVMDTVRADGLDLYGYSRETSPSLALLADRGICFDRAIAPSSWTLPSHASLFTGQDRNRLTVGVEEPLDGTFETLAEFLAKQGYATGGFVANSYFCSRWYGLNRGFLRYEDYANSPLEVFRSSALGWWICARIDTTCERLGIRQRQKLAQDFVRKDAARVNRDALTWMSGFAFDRQRRPFFAFLNYYDAHTPYVAPSTARRRFGLRPRSLRDDRLLLDGIQAGEAGISPRDVQLTRDGYDDCVASMDDQLGQLLSRFKPERGLENTLVIVTSDHGEHFGEHDRFGHTTSVYQPVIHVPLVIAGSGVQARGARVPFAVSLSDLPATVAAHVADNAKSPFPGRSLIVAGKPRGKPSADRLPMSLFEPKRGLSAAEFRQYSKPGDLAAILEDQTVLIRNGNGSQELYDLAVDPAETRNLVAAPEAKSILRRLQDGLNGRLNPPSTAAP
jgi:arylsulfatase A-like enzyme